jgi:H+/Cl- antiporter ClcA
MKITFPKIIYYVSLFCFLISFALFLYVTFGLLTYLLEEIFNTNFGLLERINHENVEQIHLKIPFIKFAVGFPTKSPVVILMLLFFGFYAFYFYVMKKFFGIFSSDLTFTKDNIKKSNQFLLINLVPILFWLSFATREIVLSKNNIFDEEFILILVHLFVLFIIYLYRDILKKGVELQEENELTI